MSKNKPTVRTRQLTEMGERILAALHLCGLSQSALERELFPSDPHQGRGRISRYMTGARGQTSIDKDLFARMADLLGVDFTWLVLGRGEPRPPLSSATETMPMRKRER